MQRGQIFELKTTGSDGQRLWAYRFRLDGRDSRRIQRGGYLTADDAREALQQALTATQRRKGHVRVTLADLAEEYLAQHDGQPETTAKLRWLLTKSTAAFGSTPLTELDAREVAAWRMTVPAGHRFEATQALRQTLARAVEWGLIDTNPAKTGVDNPQPPRREMRPFDSDGQLEALPPSSDLANGQSATGRTGPHVPVPSGTVWVLWLRRLEQRVDVCPR